MRVLSMLLLLSCATDDPGGMLPPPGDPDLYVPPLVPGETATLEASGLFVGEKAYFLLSTRGLGNGPCHPSGAPCVDLRAPLTVLGVGFADAQGVARLNVPVPATVPLGTPVALQALTVANDGATSSTVSPPVATSVEDACATLQCAPGACLLSGGLPTCLCPPGFVSTGDTCEPEPTCGDGTVDPGEECDGTSNCDANCAFIPGSIAYGPTVFETEDTAYVSLTTLGDGNVVAAYSSTPGDTLYVALLDPTGAPLSTPLALDDAVAVDVAATGNGFAVVNADPVDGESKLHVFRANGTLAAGPIAYTAPFGADSVAITTMNNGNVMVFAEGLGVQYDIFNAVGTSVLGRQGLSRSSTGAVSAVQAATFTTGRVLVTWVERYNPFDSDVWFAIIDAAGTVVVPPTVVGPTSADFDDDTVAVAPFGNDTMFLSHEYDRNGLFVLIDANGGVSPAQPYITGTVIAAAATPTGPNGDHVRLTWRNLSVGNRSQTFTVDDQGVMGPVTTFMSTTMLGQADATRVLDGKVMVGFSDGTVGALDAGTTLVID